MLSSSSVTFLFFSFFFFDLLGSFVQSKVRWKQQAGFVLLCVCRKWQSIPSDEKASNREMHPCLSVRTILSGFIKQDMLKSVIVNKWKRRYECRLWSLKQDSHFGRNIKLQIKLNTTRAYKLVMLFRDVKVGKKWERKVINCIRFFKVLEFTNSVIEFCIIKKWLKNRKKNNLSEVFR